MKHPNLDVVGRVEDVADFYRSVDLIAVPMQFGTGLKIKVSEALAAGAPLVAHRHATEGYPTKYDFHIMPGFSAMAEEIIKVAFDRSRLPVMAEASRITTGAISPKSVRHFRRRAGVCGKFFRHRVHRRADFGPQRNISFA